MNQLPSEELSKVFQKLGENTSVLLDATRYYSSIFEKYITHINVILTQNLSQYTLALQQLQEPLLRAIEGAKKRRMVVEAFQECDLWLAPSMLELYERISELYQQGKKPAIPSIIFRYYKKDDWAILRKTVNSWEQNKFFRSRMKIINDALEAHISGKYTLTVPALLPHIEGIAIDIIKKYNVPELDGPIIYNKELYGTDGKVTAPSRVLAETSISGFGKAVVVWSFLYYIEKTLYFSPHGERKGIEDLKKETSLKRNLILHGIQTKYATSMNSLRCFLALDVLSLIN